MLAPAQEPGRLRPLAGDLGRSLTGHQTGPFGVDFASEDFASEVKAAGPGRDPVVPSVRHRLFVRPTSPAAEFAARGGRLNMDDGSASTRQNQYTFVFERV